MFTEERERMNRLCQRIQEEKDPNVFTELVRELNDMLETKEQRIRQDWQNDPFVTRFR